MRHLYVLILMCHTGACQRYAERNPLPVETLPVDDTYDEYYSESYDFDDNRDIYRWNVVDFPNPQQNFRYCNRVRASYICDPDRILDKLQADKLDSYMKQLHKETTCICDECTGDVGGIVIGIALLKNMFQPYNEHPSQIIRSFTERLRERWNLGKCDNDILIVVATTDRLSYTDVGRATSAYVSLHEAYRIFVANKAHFSAGHFYEGLSAMLADYYNKTRGIRKSPVSKKVDVALIAGSIAGAVVTLALLLLIALLIYRYRKRNKDRGSSDENDGKPEGVSSGWTKKDIRVMFNSLKSTEKPQNSSNKYQPCESEDKDFSLSNCSIEEEVTDTTLVTASTADHTAASYSLSRDLSEAVKGLTDTFKPKHNAHETDL